MAATINQAYVDGFRDVLRHLAQQKTSKLRAWVDEFSPEAETGSWTRLAKDDATIAAGKTRSMATPNAERVWSTRIAVAGTYNDAELTEVEDPSMMLIDPNSNFVRSLGYSVGRQFDRIIIAGATGDAAQSLRDGSAGGAGGDTSAAAPTAESFPAGQILGDYSDPISFDMVTAVTELFNQNDVDMDEPKVAIVGPRQVRELMNLTEQTSSDYVQAQALQQNGIVPNWMGYTWIMSNQLSTGTTGQKNILFMSRRALGLHVPQDITTFVERDPSLSYAWRPYCQFSAGSVRVEDEHIVWGKVLDATVA